VSVDHYENFPVASWLCPASLRPAVRAIYHYARCADDIADEGDARAEQRLDEMSRYGKALEATLRGEDAHPVPQAWAPIFRDLRRAVVEHALPGQPLRDLLLAFEQDVRNPAYADRTQVLAYCSRSADPIGRLLLHLYRIDDAASLRRSEAVCSALQLINFWQDLSIDLPRGRVYIPAADLARHGLRLPDLHEGDSPRTKALVADLVGWARSLMLEGAPLVHRLPGRAGWELRLVVQGGLRILDKITAMDHAVLRHRPKLHAADAWPMAWAALRMRPSDDVRRQARDLAS
jgi:hydroxysqualene synthase